MFVCYKFRIPYVCTNLQNLIAIHLIIESNQIGSDRIGRSIAIWILWMDALSENTYEIASAHSIRTVREFRIYWVQILLLSLSSSPSSSSLLQIAIAYFVRTFVCNVHWHQCILTIHGLVYSYRNRIQLSRSRIQFTCKIHNLWFFLFIFNLLSVVSFYRWSLALHLVHLLLFSFLFLLFLIHFIYIALKIEWFSDHHGMGLVLIAQYRIHTVSVHWLAAYFTS